MAKSSQENQGNYDDAEAGITYGGKKRALNLPRRNKGNVVFNPEEDF